MAELSFTYRAFISYAHDDHADAVWLHRALEAYRMPRRMVGLATALGPTPPRLGKVFRDEAELAAAAELGPKIEAALKASDVLIVVCSPRSAASRWVDQEIAAFKALGREGRVFALIIDGEPHDTAEECFPAALKTKGDGSVAEPLAVDVRKFGRDDAVLRLVAGILDVGYDDLRQREMQKRRAELRRAQALFASGLLLVVAALTGGWFAADNYVRASERYTEQFAREAQVLTEEGHGAAAMLMALSSDPTGETRGFGGWLERLWYPRGFPAIRSVLIAASTHTRMLRNFVGSDSGVTSVAYSPDGATLATGSLDGSVNLWRVADGSLIRTYRYDEEISISTDARAIRKVTFSPDGTLIGVGCTDGVLLQPVDGGPARRLLRMRDLRALAFSPDSRAIYADRALWSIETGETIRRFSVADEGVDLAAVFSSDGNQLLTGSSNGDARLWRVADGALVTFSAAHRGGVTSVVFAPTGAVGTGGADGKVKFWPATGGPAYPYPSYWIDGGVSSIALSPETPDAGAASFLLIGSSTGAVTMWRTYGEVADDFPVGDFVQLDGPVTGAVFAPDGATFITTSMDHTVRLWPAALEQPRVRYRHPAMITAVAFSPDGSTVLTGGHDGVANLWPVAGGDPVATLSPHEGWVDRVGFSSDGSQIVTTERGHVRVWSRTGDLVREFGEQAEWGWTGGAVLAPSGDFVITESEGVIRRWSLGGGAPIEVYRSEPGDDFANRLAVSPDGLSLLTGANTGAVRIRGLNAPHTEIAFGHRDAIWAVAFSADNQMVLSASQDGTAKLWRPTGGRPLATFVARRASTVTSAAFSPIASDGLFVMSAGDVARIYSIYGGAPLAEFLMEPQVDSAAFAPDGRSLLIGGRGQAQLWTIPPILFRSTREIVDEVCATLDRIDVSSFSDRDRARFPILREVDDNPEDPTALIAARRLVSSSGPLFDRRASMTVYGIERPESRVLRPLMRSSRRPFAHSRRSTGSW